MLSKVILSTKIYKAIVRSTRGMSSFTQKMSTTPVEDAMRHKLTTNLNTTHLRIINESYMHNVPKNSETHFKVVVVSEKFDGLPLLKRHRLINDLLKEEFETGVHALSIVAKTPDQWQIEEKIKPSPPCLGGFGK